MKIFWIIWTTLILFLAANLWASDLSREIDDENRNFALNQQAYEQGQTTLQTKRVADALEAQNKANIVADRGPAWPEASRYVYRQPAATPPVTDISQFFVSAGCHFVPLLEDKDNQPVLRPMQDGRVHALYVRVCPGDKEAL